MLIVVVSTQILFFNPIALRKAKIAYNLAILSAIGLTRILIRNFKNADFSKTLSEAKSHMNTMSAAFRLD